MIQSIKNMAKISKWKDVLERDPFSLKGTSGEQLIKFLLTVRNDWNPELELLNVCMNPVIWAHTLLKK